MKNNKIIYLFGLLSCLIIAIISTSIVPVLAKENKVEENAKSYCLISSETGEVLTSNNEDERFPIASMCKIMTLILTFEEIENQRLTENDEIFVSERASGMGGSQVYLEANKTYVAKDLIKSIVVASANDACVAMAEKIAGSVEKFVLKMNQKAKELDMNNTNFVNPTGLPQEGQYSSAKDCTKMFNKLLKFNRYYNYSKIWMDKVTHGEERYTEISNTNKLLKQYSKCDAGKTGYTSEAGHCITASATDGTSRYIACVIGATDSKTRFNLAKNLLEYGFNNYEYTEIYKPFDVIDSVKISNSKQKSINIGIDNALGIINKKGEKTPYEIEYNFEKQSGTINKGEKIGTVSLYVNGVERTSRNIVALENADKEDYFSIFKDFIISSKFVD